MRNRVKKTIGRVLILGGALALLGWGYSSLQELWFEKAASDVLEQHLPTGQTQRKPRGKVRIVAAKPGELLGRIEIPRIHLSAMVLEGVDSSTLRFGAGHVQGT